MAQALVRLPDRLPAAPEQFREHPHQRRAERPAGGSGGGCRGGKFGARFAGSYNDQLSTTVDRRVTLPSQPIPWSNRLASVTTDPGNDLALSALPYFQLAPGFAVVGVVRYWSHGADAVEYASTTDAIPGVSAGELATDTQRSATVVGGGLSYAPSQVGTPRTARWLLDL